MIYNSYPNTLSINLLLDLSVKLLLGNKEIYELTRPITFKDID